jgi:hypothetical protein
LTLRTSAVWYAVCSSLLSGIALLLSKDSRFAFSFSASHFFLYSANTIIDSSLLA